jgi:hypothetical protein
LPHRITSVHKKAYSSVISCGHLGNWAAIVRREAIRIASNPSLFETDLTMV